MKKILFLLILLPFVTNAQNYQCLQAGVKHYFINGNGYLRGIRIDSVHTYADSTVYYPFHTPRGSYSNETPGTAPSLDPNGGSWLGKKVLQKSDGTFIFDSYWNDSVVIKTLANVGDSWVFYQDASPLYYTATVASTGVMPVLSTPDSVKTIMINAYNGASLVTSDPVNGFTIILSKNYGFVQVPDLYTFPYHKPDSAYRFGLDFYLDRSMCIPSDINRDAGIPAPNVLVSEFKLVDLINPNEQQLTNWNTGDIIESDKELGIPIFTPITITYYRDTVTDKVVSGDNVTYTINRSEFLTLSDLTYPLMNSLIMPEETGPNRPYLFYYPADTSFCSLAPAYTVALNRYYPWGLGWESEWTSYKFGIGRTLFVHQDGDPHYETDRLLYYKIGGISCGTQLPPSAVDDVNAQIYKITLYPNPVTATLTIASSIKVEQVTITNLLGQTVVSNNYNSKEVQIDVADLPSGVYIVKVNGSEVRRFVKE